MECFITSTVLGFILCVLGCMNMKGNISSLHWYHRQRVTEEDRKPFGKLCYLLCSLPDLFVISLGNKPVA